MVDYIFPIHTYLWQSSYIRHSERSITITSNNSRGKTSLMDQWLRLKLSNAEGVSLIPGWESGPHMPPGPTTKRLKQKQCCNKCQAFIKCAGCSAQNFLPDFCPKKHTKGENATSPCWPTSPNQGSGAQIHISSFSASFHPTSNSEFRILESVCLDILLLCERSLNEGYLAAWLQLAP